MVQRKKLNDVDRWEQFWSNVEKTDTCWNWTGRTNSGGYGSATLGGRHCSAHRLMMFWVGRLSDVIHTGTKSVGVVLHSCDNRRCVNPAHLSVGTASRNQQEAYARGRRAQPRGSAHVNAKLTDEQVREIRSLYDSGRMKQVPLACKYGVTQRVISLIVRRESYK